LFEECISRSCNKIEVRFHCWNDEGFS
jgi:hypothetical protein